ncbi:S-layer family protein [Geminocystis sp. NIES-3709]|uniref:beta strand repeat-containing protein n=1 Tax=Geminocystis sp. NIES-3709 TaxID=1617448 RepID=UPI0005FC8E96|nr:right-handed parallel beta-helix repeat-containing protein [Geminocystis sp. NIES-3709]BAQ66285.1 alkaline phosphatase [Geminocystis sp. NIES-3709]
MTIELNITDNVTQILTDFADSATFWDDFNLIFGTEFNQTIAEDFRNQWLNQDFSVLPIVEIISSNILGNANGGYSSDNNTIYLSDRFLTMASSATVTSILLEEIGHFIDAKINDTDTLGDEGEHFAKVIQGIELTSEDLQALKSENDFATIVIDRQSIQIETSTTFTVINTNDSGDGSLRKAIIDANNTAGTDTITFNIGGSGTVKTILLLSALPTITETIIINGTTQSGFSSTPIIELNGLNAGTNINGIILSDGSSGSTIQGLVINRFNGNGIVIQGDSTGNTIKGNFIGIGGSGASDQGNGSNGIRIETANNIIGGSNANERNVISGNTQTGIFITGTSATDNTIQGNYIGINATGTGAIKNDTYGIQIANGSKNNLIGTNGDGTNDNTEGNVISGNGDIGIITENNGTTGNVIAGNYIGTNPTGTSAIANKRGIYIANGAENTLVGTNSDGVSDDLERNIISGNTENGIWIVNGSGTTQNHTIKGNYIGTSKDGSADLGNGNNGIEINGATNITIGGSNAVDRNIISGNNQRGIFITGSTASGNTIEGNYIGTNKDGNGDLGNSWEGITIESSSNTIKNNLISGNDGSQGGLYLNGTNANNNTIIGNKIGTDATGNSKIGNSTGGITINNGSNNTIGVSNALDRNIISGNNEVGIVIKGSSATNQLIQNNYIGTDIDGDTALGNGFEGITIETTQNTIKNNVISANGGSQGGLWLNGVNAKNNTIIGNKIGTDTTGNVDLGNVQEGITINNATNNTIGGSNANDRNIISGNNTAGILVVGNSSDNLIEGNYIGTDIDGDTGLGNNFEGVGIYSSPSNTIKNNVISANKSSVGGVVIEGSNTKNNWVTGNKIGTDATGNNNLGNTSRGISINDGSSNNIIGSNEDKSNDNNEGNIIANNSNGVFIDGSNNSIVKNQIINNSLNGIAIVNGSNSVNNLISQNKITNNGELGIDLNYDGITANDPNDTDTGTNNRQNYPLITIDNSGFINGFLNSNPNSTIRIEYFSNTTPDASGKGEGETFIGFEDVTTDSNGNATLNFDSKNAPNVTATATIANNTSEFSSPAIIPVVTIEAIDATANENGNIGTFRISRTGDLIALTVNYTITGTATNGVDYNTITSSIEIPLNQTYADITITPIDDFIDNEDTTVILTLTDSNDYDLGTSGTETDTITIENDDTVGVTITESGGNTTVTEGGGNDSYSIVLNSEPTDDVTINISTDTQVDTNVSSITFTSLNWDTPQTINVSAPDDGIDEGNHSGIIIHSVVSNDVKYDNISVNPINVTVIEPSLVYSRGTGNPDNITGGYGKNIIDAGGSNDYILGNIFQDTLLGGSGNDTIKADDGDDILDGGSGNDILKAGEGNDIIKGGSGNDTLIGGMGNDTLTGGSGNDYFRFNSPNDGIDTITDFNVLYDSIYLTALGFNLSIGELNSNQFIIGTNATASDHRLVFDRNTGDLFFDNDGNGVNSPVQIATLNPRLALTNQDFIII